MAEAIEPLPADAGPVEGLGWTRDGSRIAVRTATATLETPAPPGRVSLALAPPERAAEADSSTRVVVGDPPFGVIDRCGGEPCVRAGADTTPLGSGARDAIRWGADSLAYFVGDRFEIRPVGGGHPRTPTWTDPPRNVRQPTYNPGSTDRSAR
jgi:hypothetical protein